MVTASKRPARVVGIGFGEAFGFRAVGDVYHEQAAAGPAVQVEQGTGLDHACGIGLQVGHVLGPGSEAEV